MSQRAIEAIKGAILLEKRGQVFYRSIASNSDSDAVKDVFTAMAEEEKKHEEMLSLHYSSLVKEGRLAAVTKMSIVEDHTGEILTPAVKDEIEAAGFEAAAISAAMALEKEAELYYLEKAEEAESELEKDLFKWLARWEHGHLELLASMDRALMESIWFENNFWPEV